MEIDWITASAQIVNFLILVWLLKRFLYQPVIRAMDRREQRIADQLNEARAREQTAEENVHRYQEKTEELERKRDQILAKAKEEAEQQKKQMLEEARAQVAETRANWQRHADREKEEFLGNLRRQAAEAIQTIARKALGDLADAELEECVVQRFIDRLKSLDTDARQALADTSELVRIASAFKLDSTVRGRLTRAIHEHLIDGIEVEYTRSPELLCGIELTTGGRRLSWNLADYLEELTGRVEVAFAAALPTK
jgi:F-type H+-transporting ATPase subunit b